VAEIWPSERKPSPALSCGVNDSSGDRTVAATVSQVGLEDVPSGPMMIGEPGADLSGIDMATAAVHALDHADKENNWDVSAEDANYGASIFKVNHAACHP
jgi:hypothetical protein